MFVAYQQNMLFFLFPSFSDPLELHVVIETQVSKRHFAVTHDVKQ